MFRDEWLVWTRPFPVNDRHSTLQQKNGNKESQNQKINFLHIVGTSVFGSH
jgi:hypothetical protein